jgi:hypothetical protein
MCVSIDVLLNIVSINLFQSTSNDEIKMREIQWKLFKTEWEGKKQVKNKEIAWIFNVQSNFIMRVKKGEKDSMTE